MMKNIFSNKRDLANKFSPVSSGLFVACICLLSGSCDSDSFLRDDDGRDTAPVALQFSTSVEGLSPTVDSRVINPDGGMMDGTKFPEGVHNIGMFITKSSAAGGEVFPGSAENMKAVLTRKSNGTESWECFKKDDTKTTPQGDVGKNIQVLAYWPYIAGATVSGIPFDFSRDVKVNMQTELLYNKQEKQTQKIGNNGSIPLAFSHAYSLITLKIRKSVNAGNIKVSSVSVANTNGTWIKNKGLIDPVTGYPTKGAQPGDITDNTESTLLRDADVTYNFLIPAFMSESVNDGSIGFRLLVEGKESVFELKKEHLNRMKVGSAFHYGFSQGLKNTYNLIYDNVSLSLQLRDWSTVNLEGDFGIPGIVDPSYEGWMFDHKDIPAGEIPTTPPVSDHLYESYLSDADRLGNGAAFPWAGFDFIWMVEPPRSPIQFALEDALPLPVQWRDPNGLLLAKQICKSYREGGYSNWRLPRLAEWYLFERRINAVNDSYLYYPQAHGGMAPSSNKWYWSGSETSPSVQDGPASGVVAVRLSISSSTVNNKEGQEFIHGSSAFVRCVRDAERVTK